ncbi:peptidylprolyl isomerase [Amycolatopsis rubida]|uniref:Peptidyl-prolyl cis-trans isomerase n=1 Tax=Amycolatopsis rubida TaxID=112413 RepID=A0A1I6AWX9_9PSEU|nr:MULTISPECIES: peptidylprolyl isomerase [Amycolatopsis]MYW91784.1 peptidylprolyl isomerase [Amycolatopsis rubida]NEC56769.1 peptidylprolyl isomerase [Amycolatopsis rubida]OAP21711.1 putative peptidyl-prolyl cis-trans isomerase [Amycolatopsis sp. M39]SFQ73218.1 peptidyl-prolyl cis-trans isomerase B (cyclophilin B) [Amycolatopsis rubida]
MKPRWAALAAAVIAGLSLGTAAPASAAPPVRPPVVQCTFTPTPENPAARPVLRPLPFALTRGTIDVTFHYNYGPVTVRLNSGGAAPCAVANMASLVLQHFYDRSRCWRLSNSARLGVLQCGDIYEVEKGGPGYKFPDEVTGEETYERGTVAMGNQGPGTNGSEFFIVHSFAHIPANYSVLGKVVRGMEVLDRMVADGIVPTDPNGPLDGAPKHPVKIRSVSFGR